MNRTDLTRYTELIARRWRLLAIVIGLALNASILQSFLATETFETTSRIVIAERPAGDLLLDRPARDLDRALQTELRALESAALETTVNELLRVDELDVDFDTEDPDLLLVTARHNTADGAAVIADTYASSFVALRQNEAIEALELARGQVEGQLSTLQIEIDDLESQLAIDPADLRASVRLDARLRQQNELLSQIDDIDFLIVSDPAGIELGEPAVVPTDPISPRPVRSALFAFVLGAVLAVVIALILDSVDDTIRSATDLDAADTGVPILGAVPPTSLREDNVASLVEPDSPTAEAYRILRASVLHSMGRKPNLLIQVTSAGPNEGKTNVAANLAVSFAAIGIKTALVDADLRSDGLGTRFEELGGPGLVELLTGERGLDEPLKRLGRTSTLRGLGRGEVNVNPAEVLSIDRARSVFRHLKESFDVTVIDTPEVLPYADATVVSGMVDGTVVVLRSGETRRRALDEAFVNLGLVDARIIGTVLVDAPDGLRRADPASRGFVPFDERMLALGVGPPQLAPVPADQDGSDESEEDTGPDRRRADSAEEPAEQGQEPDGADDPIALPAIGSDNGAGDTAGPDARADHPSEEAQAPAAAKVASEKSEPEKPETEKPAPTKPAATKPAATKAEPEKRAGTTSERIGADTTREALDPDSPAIRTAERRRRAASKDAAASRATRSEPRSRRRSSAEGDSPRPVGKKTSSAPKRGGAGGVSTGDGSADDWSGDGSTDGGSADDASTRDASTGGSTGGAEKPTRAGSWARELDSSASDRPRHRSRMGADAETDSKTKKKPSRDSDK